VATFASAAQVRDYLNVSGSAGPYSEAMLGSNSTLASGMLQKRTGRLFETSSNSKVFSTGGKSALTIPDLRLPGTVLLNGVELTRDSTYYLVPDRNNSGVFVAIEFPGRTGYFDDYRRYPDWFDRGLDDPRWRNRTARALPNDLEFRNPLWGHSPLPAELIQATVILAAWLTKRSTAGLANVVIAPEGGILDYTAWPPEVRSFVDDWRILDSTVESI